MCSVGYVSVRCWIFSKHVWSFNGVRPFQGKLWFCPYSRLPWTRKYRIHRITLTSVEREWCCHIFADFPITSKHCAINSKWKWSFRINIHFYTVDYVWWKQGSLSKASQRHGMPRMRSIRGASEMWPCIYIGQTRQCFSESVLEHKRNVKTKQKIFCHKNILSNVPTAPQFGTYGACYTKRWNRIQNTGAGTSAHSVRWELHESPSLTFDVVMRRFLLL